MSNTAPKGAVGHQTSALFGLDAGPVLLIAGKLTSDS